MNLIWMIACLLILTLCTWSASRYWRIAQAKAAVLVLLLGIAVCALLQWDLVERFLQSRFDAMNISTTQTIQWDSDRQPVLSATMSKQLEQASSIAMSGDGLRASQWRDLPARHLQWQAPTGRERLLLQAPTSLQLGREFAMQITRPSREAAGTVNNSKAWSAQLLNENGSVLAEQSSNTQVLQLHWLPPLAERMELQLKVFDHAGKLIDSGPVPLEVKPHRPLQVKTYFDSPSFDISSLRQLLQVSEANLDSQTRLGQNVQQRSLAREKMEASDLLIVDAAYWENAKPVQRQAILQAVSAGSSLMILGSNARQPAIWRDSLGLELRQNPAASQATDAAELSFDLSLISPRIETTTLSMSTTAWQAQINQRWMPLDMPFARATSANAIVARSYQQGRIVWLGLSDWHRYTISAPETLKLWWQLLLDQSLQNANEASAIEIKESMPMVGERLMFCVDAESGYTHLRPLSQASIALRVSEEFLGQRCAAWRPMQAGWQAITLTVNEETAVSVDAKSKRPTAQQDHLQQHWIYVYAEQVWPAWQRELKRQASLAYQDRIPNQPDNVPKPLPRWPLMLLLLTLSLVLWRIDTRH